MTPLIFDIIPPIFNMPSCFNLRHWKSIFTDKHWIFGAELLKIFMVCWCLCDFPKLTIKICKGDFCQGGTYLKIWKGRGALIQRGRGAYLRNTVRGNIMDSYLSSWRSTITTTSSCIQIAVQLSYIIMSCLKYNSNRYNCWPLMQQWLNIRKMIQFRLMCMFKCSVKLEPCFFVCLFVFCFNFFSKSKKSHSN